MSRAVLAVLGTLTYVAACGKAHDCAHNCRGIILSWAILGQRGNSHVNNHANRYIVDVFHELGYRHREDLDKKFRRKATYYWFKRSIMVFERYNPLIC